MGKINVLFDVQREESCGGGTNCDNRIILIKGLGKNNFDRGEG